MEHWLRRVFVSVCMRVCVCQPAEKRDNEGSEDR